VHVNRLKQAYKHGIWKAKGQGRCYRKLWIRRQEPEEDEPALLAPGPMSIPAPQDDNRQLTPGTPSRSPSHQMEHRSPFLWTPLDRRE